MRLFYASFLATEHMDSYGSCVASVAAEVPGVLRSVPGGTHHLTLAFLGEVDDRDAPAYLEVLEAVKSFPSFPFTLGRPRILSSRRTPRLVCVDLEQGGERVTLLQKQLCEGLSQRFPTAQVRPKPPHVTLARFRKKASRQAAARVAEAFARLEDSAPPRADRLDAVHLVRSTLTPQGPVYESLGQALLAQG